MSALVVALLQMRSHGTDQDANLQKGDTFCRHARDLGADIALFPEMWSIGYSSYKASTVGPDDLWRAPDSWTAPFPTPRDSTALGQARTAWQARAIGPNDPFLLHFRALASALDMAIAVTYLERWPVGPRNSVSLIDRHGEIVLTYAKIHTCDFSFPEDICTPGDDFQVASLDTVHGPVQVGAMICFDREYPESARILMLKGAEVILTPNACHLDINRIAQFRTRAFENMVGVAMTNYAAPEQNGHSVAFDPVTFDTQGNGRDTLVVEAGEGEGIYLAPFDLERLRSYRSREVWGNAFRRPHRYSLLAAPVVTPPFVRVDIQGVAYDPARR